MRRKCQGKTIPVILKVTISPRVYPKPFQKAETRRDSRQSGKALSITAQTAPMFSDKAILDIFSFWFYFLP